MDLQSSGDDFTSPRRMSLPIPTPSNSLSLTLFRQRSSSISASYNFISVDALFASTPESTPKPASMLAANSNADVGDKYVKMTSSERRNDDSDFALDVFRRRCFSAGGVDLKNRLRLDIRSLFVCNLRLDLDRDMGFVMGQ